MKMGQLFVNSFTLRYCSLKFSLSLHKQIKSAAFEGQDRYCIILSDWCIISSVVTVPVYSKHQSSTYQILFTVRQVGEIKMGKKPQLFLKLPREQAHWEHRNEHTFDMSGWSPQYPFYCQDPRLGLEQASGKWVFRWSARHIKWGPISKLWMSSFS